MRQISLFLFVITICNRLELGSTANCAKSALVRGSNTAAPVDPDDYTNPDTDTTKILAPSGTVTVKCNTNYNWAVRGESLVGTTGKVYTCTQQDVWTAQDSNMNCVPVCAKSTVTYGSNVAHVDYTLPLGPSPGYVSAPSGTDNIKCNDHHIWSDGTTANKALPCTAAGTWSTSPDCVPVCTQPPTSLGTQVSSTITYTDTLGGYVKATAGTAVLSCNTGHVWSDGGTGSRSITCTAANTWGTSDNCVAVCTKPPATGNQVSGTIVYGSTLGASFINAVSGTADLTCNDNHAWSSDGTTAAKQIKCTSAATWEASPACSPVCTKPPTVGEQVSTTIGTYTNAIGTLYVTAPSGTAAVTCNDNHIWSDGQTGTKTITCTAANQWATSPYCVPVCDKPPTVGTNVNNAITYTGTIGVNYVQAPSGTAILSCDTGKIWADGATGTKSIGCTAANTWGTSESCVAACPMSPTLGSEVSSTVVYANELGSTHVSASTGTATLSCNANHVWSDATTGTKVLTCSSTGTWPASLDCVPVCAKPPSVGNFVNPTPTGYVNEFATDYVKAPGGTATVKCNTGYYWYDGSTGAKTIMCASAGSWTGAAHCKAICNKSPTLGDKVDTTATTYYGILGDTEYITAGAGGATIQCSTGYVWADGNGCATRTLACTGLLTWQSSPSCVLEGTVTQTECAITTTRAPGQKDFAGNRKTGDMTAWYILIGNAVLVAIVLVLAAIYGVRKESKRLRRLEKEGRVDSIAY